MVRDGQIVGQAGTAPRPGPHAEPQALEQAGVAARGADLYVTLEPCHHHGLTPPCTAAIIAAGVARCFYACPDPNPLAGDGAAFLAAAGIETVHVDDCAAAAESLQAYLHHQRTARPFVIAKWAMSLDGRVALPGSRRGYLSSPQARALVHKRRAEVDAVMVGSGTALADDPQLTVRSQIAASRQPLRIVLDGRARLPVNAAMLSEAGRTICFVSQDARADRVGDLTSRGCLVQAMPTPPRKDPAAVLERLGAMGIQSVLLEGGPQTLTSFLAAGLVDEIEVFVCPILVGDPQSPTALAQFSGRWRPPELDLLECERVGPDLWLRARPRKSDRVDENLPPKR